MEGVTVCHPDIEIDLDFGPTFEKKLNPDHYF